VRSFFNTDKIYLHDYFPEYMKIAAALGPKARTCELGVKNGESLRMWQALFPLGQVTGVDINTGSVFPQGTRRIIASQDDPKLAELGPFDLVVDDASHSGKLSQRTFEIMWPRVNPAGFYVLEDWFIGLERQPNDEAYDPAMLHVVQGFLRLLVKNGDCESVLCKYGLAILRKKACA
jgi:hypothetical protein